MVTRWHPEDPERLQMVAIRRRDTGDWAIPGGMVDAGENVSITVRREFGEEAGNIADPDEKATFEKLADELFSRGCVIFKGYVDDPRNTDNAWIETTAFHFHCGHELGRLLPLEAGDDAAAVRWFDLGNDSANKLYPPHRGWIGQLAAQMIQERRSSSSVSEATEAARVISYNLAPSLSDPILRASFAAFDTFNRGYLSMEQIASIYSNSGTLSYSKEEGIREAERVMAMFSQDGGRLTYENFAQWWKVRCTQSRGL